MPLFTPYSVLHRIITLKDYLSSSEWEVFFYLHKKEIHMAAEMRFEKKQFMGKRNAYKEASPFVDDLLKFKDKMTEVANDSGLKSSYLTKEILDLLGFFDDEFSEEDEEEEDEGPVEIESEVVVG